MHVVMVGVFCLFRKNAHGLLCRCTVMCESYIKTRGSTLQKCHLNRVENIECTKCFDIPYPFDTLWPLDPDPQTDTEECDDTNEEQKLLPNHVVFIEETLEYGPRIVSYHLTQCQVVKYALTELIDKSRDWDHELTLQNGMGTGV